MWKWGKTTSKLKINIWLIIILMLKMALPFKVSCISWIARRSATFEEEKKTEKQIFLLSLDQSDAFSEATIGKYQATPWPIVVSQRSWLAIWFEEIADMIWKASSMFCNSRPVEWRHADKKQVGCGCDVIEGPRHQLLGKLTNNPVIAKNNYTDRQPKDQPKEHLVCSKFYRTKVRYLPRSNAHSLSKKNHPL